MEPKDRIIVALDVDDIAEVETLIGQLAPYVGAFKIGLQLISRHNAVDATRYIHGQGGRVFWDGKLHDIPNTVAKAARAIAAFRVEMFNVHISGGVPMMRAAVENRGEAIVLGVTILTSLDDERHEPEHIYGAPSWTKVVQFAIDAQNAGLDGIICSPKELSLLKRQDLGNLLKVTPGVRPHWAEANDQARVMTPGEAVAAGADYLVIGRPILQPPPEIGTPVDAAKRIIEEITLAEAQT